MTRSGVGAITSALAAVSVLALAVTATNCILFWEGFKHARETRKLWSTRQMELARAQIAQKTAASEDDSAQQLLRRLGHLHETRNPREFQSVFSRELGKFVAQIAGARLVSLQIPTAVAANETVTTSLNPAKDAVSAAAASPSKKDESLFVVEVTIRGSFDNLRSFIENLRSFPLIAAVEELKIQPDAAPVSGRPQALLMRAKLATLPVKRRSALGVPQQQEETDEESLLGKNS